MKKLPNIIFCLCILFVSVNFAQNQSVAQTKSKTSVNKKVKSVKAAKKKTQIKRIEKTIQDPANVTALELSQTEIVLNCPATDESCSSSKIIEVKTVATDSGNGGVEYSYIVSAGKIIGEGAIVKWDLSDAKPGTYTITAGINQPVWGVLGQTRTKAITIKECPDCK